MIPSIQPPLPHGGCKIVVHDEGSDSLAILTVRRRHGTLSVETVLRGNWDAKQRPAARSYATMRAPDVSAEEIAERKRRWYNLNSWRRGVRDYWQGGRT